MKLIMVAGIWSELVNDPDDVPTLNGGVHRYWGAWPDSPLPDQRLFAIFNREPNSEAEAFAAAKEQFA